MGIMVAAWYFPTINQTIKVNNNKANAWTNEQHKKKKKKKFPIKSNAHNDWQWVYMCKNGENGENNNCWWWCMFFIYHLSGTQKERTKKKQSMEKNNEKHEHMFRLLDWFKAPIKPVQWQKKHILLHTLSFTIWHVTDELRILYSLFSQR